MASVFLSYDHDDAALSKPLINALEKAGHTVWFDRHIHGGAQYSRKIEQALDEADAVVVLWTPCSLESAWVRDEAAEGRDRGKLIPLSVGGVTPPIGFRQFQTIDLGAWKGRGKVPRLAELMEAIDSQAPRSASPAAVSPKIARDRPADAKPWLIGAAALILLVVILAGVWSFMGRAGLPVVEVASADGSPRSNAAANELFVKLGTLAQIGGGKWQLVDAASAPRKPDFVFRAADTGSAGQPDPALVLLDGKDNSVLWSREFSSSEAGADLRQQMSLTAGRVLGCALDARASGLRRDLLKVFLDGCAQMAEASQDRPDKVAGAMRAVVTGAPKFAPGWAHMLIADVNVFSNGGTDDQRRQIQEDIRAATKIAPDLPEITIAQSYLLPTTEHAKLLDLLAKAKAQAPDKPEIYSEEVTALMRVGRMSEAIASARRAAELDPLSPSTETQLIMTLAHSGRVGEARQELQRAEKIWSGTGALRDAEYGFNLRYGDARAALKMQPFALAEADELYARARENPSPQNIDALARWFRPFVTKRDPSFAGVAVQALGQFHQTDDVFQWLAMVPTSHLAEAFYVLFRPYLADVRKDPRFMLVAKRAGLINYWRSSGIWPDYCYDPQLPYDCKKEAAKLS
jgi:tetratricopeptide (TPR) repeat protein